LGHNSSSHLDPTHHHHPHDHDRGHGRGRFHAIAHRAGHWLERINRRRLLAVLAALYLLSGFYFVFADQQAVVLLFGRVRETRVPPGIHWTWPYPLAQVHKLKVLETKRLTIGVEAPDQVLGRGSGEIRTQFLTGDQNIINVRLAVQYTVQDPVSYLFHAGDVTSVIAKSVETALSSVIVRRRVDDLLTTEKVVVQQEVQSSAQSLLDEYRCGALISSISLESVAPPDEVLEAFRDVASAREDKDRIMQEAESYSNAVVPRARGEAARLTAEATSYCERKVNEAEGDAARFVALATEYARARDVTGARLFLETMEEVLPRLKKIVVESGAGGIDLDLIEKK
jgi:membrane protease subunit HflK